MYNIMGQIAACWDQFVCQRMRGKLKVLLHDGCTPSESPAYTSNQVMDTKSDMQLVVVSPETQEKE